VKLNDPKVEGLLRESAFRIHAKAMTFNFTGSRSDGDQAWRLPLAFARSSGFNEVDGVPTYKGANQCALDISIFVPLLIDSAILLERHRGWRPSDRRALQLWLADVPYKTTSAIARTRRNNWGTAAAFASWSIAHYLIGSGIELEEVYPERRILNASEARDAHLQTQIDKMSTTWRVIPDVLSLASSRMAEFRMTFGGDRQGAMATISTRRMAHTGIRSRRSSI